jgi:hypothetical protein
VDFVELAWIPLVLGPKLVTGKMEQHGRWHVVSCAGYGSAGAEPFQSGISNRPKTGKARLKGRAFCSFYIQSSKLEGVIVPCFRHLYPARNQELGRNRGLEGA